MSRIHYEKFLIVSEEHLDELNHVNNVIYVKWVQDVAAAHWNQISPPGFSEKYLWVVQKHTIEYKKPALLGEEIILRTWVETIEAAKSERHVEIVSAKTGLVFCKAQTVWCLIDKNTHRPCRIDPSVALALKK